MSFMRAYKLFIQIQIQMRLSQLKLFLMMVMVLWHVPILEAERPDNCPAYQIIEGIESCNSQTKISIEAANTTCTSDLGMFKLVDKKIHDPAAIVMSQTDTKWILMNERRWWQVNKTNVWTVDARNKWNGIIDGKDVYRCRERNPATVAPTTTSDPATVTTTVPTTTSDPATVAPTVPTTTSAEATNADIPGTAGKGDTATSAEISATEEATNGDVTPGTTGNGDEDEGPQIPDLGIPIHFLVIIIGSALIILAALFYYFCCKSHGANLPPAEQLILPMTTARMSMASAYSRQSMASRVAGASSVPPTYVPPDTSPWSPSPSTKSKTSSKSSSRYTGSYF